MTITLPDTDAVDEHGYVPVISLAGLDDPARRAEIAGQLGTRCAAAGSTWRSTTSCRTRSSGG